MRLDTRLNYFLFGIFVAALVLPFLDGLISLSLALLLFIYLTVVVSFHYRKRRETRKNRIQIKKNKEHKMLEKITRKRHIEQEKKHDAINNQIAHIQQLWDLSQDQQKTFVRFIEKRAYSDLYTKMTASLLPQLSRMIEICLEQNKSGCKRQIQKRINELVKIMKSEIAKTDARKRDDFETTSEVYDQLLHEIKPKY